MAELHPDYEAVLYHLGAPVTTKFKDIIYQQVFGRALAQNIQQHTAWTKTQFEQISWKAYEAAFRGLTIHRKISVAKLSHGLWNSGAQKKLYGINEDGYCPICRNTVETFEHIFRCGHDTAITMKLQLLEQLEEELYILGAAGSLVESLFQGLTWWLIGGEEECPRAPGYGSIYSLQVWSTAAYVDQTKLGWGQMLRGRVSKLWGDAYVKEQQSQKPNELHLSWTKRLICLMWEKSFLIWELRNTTLHGATMEEQAALRQAQLQGKIQDLYQQYSANPLIVPSSSQHLFSLPIASLLAKYRQYQLCWVRSVEVAMAHQRADPEKLRRQAERFFGPTTSKPFRHLNHLQLSLDSQTQVRHLPPEDFSSPHHHNLRRP